jgi:hypothetical protein
MSEPSIEEIEKSSPFPLTDKDRYNLSLQDAEFYPHTWEELKAIIGVLDCLYPGQRPSNRPR